MKTPDNATATGEGIVSQFRKKPVVVEAMQYNGQLDGFEAAYVFMGWNSRGHSFRPERDFPRSLIIETLEGELRCNPGDWIIRGVKGEFYPIKPDIFAATYEPAAAPLPSSSEEVSEEGLRGRRSCVALPKLYWTTKHDETTCEPRYL